MSDKSHALGMLNVSRETIARLDIFESLLRRWVGVTNLIGPAEIPFLWTRHFIDSLQLRSFAHPSDVVVDLGTGAGFPGLVLALDRANDSGATVHLVEPDGRKCAFLREVIRATDAPATVHRARAEDVIGQLGRIDIVTSRAMAPLEILVRTSEKQLRSGAKGLFPKGRGYRSEIAALSNCADTTVEVLPSITNADAAIIRIQMSQTSTRGDS